MPLNKAQLKAGIKSLTAQMRTETDEAVADEKFAQGLADLIEQFVKTGTVTVAAGITLSTTAPATGSTTSTGTGTIS